MIQALVDTHVLLWAIAEPRKLPKRFRSLLRDPENTILFSAASVWEVAIKMQIGRLDLGIGPEDIAQAAEAMGFEALAITTAHAAEVGRLPLHHRDPFDRVLVAQAIRERARLMTVDQQLGRYSELVLLPD